MVNKNDILQVFEKEGFSEVDQIDYKNDIMVYNFYYSFDQAEIEAAKEYANENSSQEESEDNWYEEYFIPYLTDIAGDNVKEVVEEICENNDLEGEFVAYEIDRFSYEQCEFIVVLAKEGTEFDIDTILNDLDL